MKKFLACAAFFLMLSAGQASAWTEYKPATFAGDMNLIYSEIPVFHGYTAEFLSSPAVKQVCGDARSDGVILDYCR